MATIALRDSARKTLDTIVRDRRRDVGFVAARKLRERLMGSIYRLRDYPELGRRLLEFPDANLHQLIVPPYRILYQFADDTVTILDIVYGHSIFPENNPGDFEP